MPTDQTERLADLVASALDCAVSERAQFLSDVCGDDVALREEAEALLRFEDSARDFIEIPAYDVAANEVAAALSEPVTEEEPISQSEAPAAESFLETEPDEPIIEQEPSREIESSQGTHAPEPIFESETVESLLEKEVVPESETTESPIAQAPLAESESTELVNEQEQAYAHEPSESMAAPEPNLELASEQEASLQERQTEVTPAPETIVESEATEPVIEQKPLFATETSEPVNAQETTLEGEAVIASAPERRIPEIKRGDREEAAAAAILEEPKPKDKSVPPPPKKSRDSFEIPASSARDRIPSRSGEFVWTKRVTLAAVALLVVAMGFGLNYALRNAKDARRQRDIAQAEQSRTERINTYLQEIISFSDQNLTSVWPVPQNRNIVVTEMLDRVVPRVQKELAAQPDVRGELLRIIGDAYAAQGDHNAAEKNLRAALQAQTNFYGDQNAEVTDTMVDLGVLLYRREKFADAEELLEKAATFLRKQNEMEGGRSNAIKLAFALDQLGAVKFYRGDVKAGRAILEEALQIASQAQPKDRDRSVLTNIKTDLGGLLVLVGELSQGERLLQEALAEWRSATTTSTWETGVTLQMLGELSLAKNRPREAEENFLLAEEVYRKTLGEKNLYFARNLERRATVALIENDLSSAEELAQRSLAIVKECSPQDKLPWTDPMMTLSSIFLKAGRAAEGEDYLRKTIRICEEQSSRNYAAIALAKIRLSQLLLSQKRFTEAENLAFEAHNQAQQHLQPQDPMRKATTNNLIEIYEVQEKHAAARAVK